MRQNTQQLARANLANIVASESAGAALAQNALLAAATDQSLADIVSKGRKDFSTLNESERVRFNAHMMALLNHTQVGYLGFKRGTAPPEYWQAYAGGLAPLLRTPGARDWWRHARMNFAPEARAYFYGLAGDGPMQPPGLYPDHPIVASPGNGKERPQA